MPNAKTVPTPSSNNQNNAIPIPSERIFSVINTQSIMQSIMHIRPQIRIIRYNDTPLEIINFWECEEIPMENQESYENRLREILANRQDPNPNDELLRFSEDDIDSNIDSDIDSDRDW